jgi:hypothetical protein
LAGLGFAVGFGLAVGVPGAGAPLVTLPAALGLFGLLGLFDEEHPATRLNATARSTRVDR